MHKFEKVFDFKTRQGYFTHSFLPSILSEKNLYFGKYLFAKQELITRARLRVQDFGTGKNFCFNQLHNKEFLSFFLGKVI